MAGAVLLTTGPVDMGGGIVGYAGYGVVLLGLDAIGGGGGYPLGIPMDEGGGGGGIICTCCIAACCCCILRLLPQINSVKNTNTNTAAAMPTPMGQVTVEL